MSGRKQGRRRTIEITPEMIAVGVRVLSESTHGDDIRFDTDEEIVTKVYLAMSSAARSKPKATVFDSQQIVEPMT